MVLFVCTSKVWKNKTVKFGYIREVGVEMGERINFAFTPPYL